MRTVAIHQPQYLPWLPYLAKAAECDIFVFLDNVKYQKNGFQNRNMVKAASGPVWLTIPVHAGLDTLISDVRIAGQAWRRKHLKTIEQNYRGAPYFESYAKTISGYLGRQWERLVEINVETCRWLFHEFDIRCQTVMASSLEATGKGDDLVLAICKELGADVYLSGQGARAYQDEEKFADASIELRYQQYVAPHYRQCHSDKGFIPSLSAIDLLLNEGRKAGNILRHAGLAE